MIQPSIIVLNAPDNVSQNGPAQLVNKYVSASFCPIFGDMSANGTVKIQGSNDVAASQSAAQYFTPTNWNDIPNATSTITSGVGPAIVLPTMNFQWIRVVYTSSSGGTTTVVVKMTPFGT